MKTTTIKVKAMFIEPVLGSASGNPELHREYIAAKAPTTASIEEEVKAVTREEADAITNEEVQKARTIFPNDDKGLFLWDYQVRGFLKEALKALVVLRECDIARTSVAHSVDSFVFVEPRRIYFTDPAGRIITKPESDLQRPLRCETMQGPRVALASSEQLPVGTSIEFTIKVLEPAVRKLNKNNNAATATVEQVLAALLYGQSKGLGQWRSGGWGRFTAEAVVNGTSIGAFGTPVTPVK